MKRAVLTTAEEPKKARSRVESGRLCFSAGNLMINLLLGDGWSEEQIINLVGDSGTGKSLLALEAAANFLLKYPNGTGIVRIIDTENAFDESIAGNLGIDLRYVQRPSTDEVPRTVEGVMIDVDVFINCTSPGLKSSPDPDDDAEVAKAKKKKKKKRTIPEGTHILYIIDSWDGLSSNDELERDIEATNTYGTKKAAKGSEFARRVTSGMEGSKFTMLIVSQVRENIGVSFGAKYSRSGGKWLDFYCTQIMWLAYGDKLEATRARSKRTYGRWIIHKVTKNRRRKPAPPVQTALVYDYGTDELISCCAFLLQEHRAQEFFPEMTKEDASKALKEFIPRIWSLPEEEYRPSLKKARKLVRQAWREIDEAFTPPRRKYGAHRGKDD